MRITARLFLFLLLLITAATDGRLHLSTAAGVLPNDSKRIRFHVQAVEETVGSRNVISETVIEGPPGTDFNINLQSSRFKMGAKFLTDLASANLLRVRAKLDTRRLFGYSESKLPIYEEDSQEQALELGFDELIVLLPFGKGDKNNLKIEITPSLSEKPVYLASGKAAPLEIDILKQSPGGSINVQASKIPHNFEVEAVLIEGGREVARATASCLIEQKQELLLVANSQASPEVASNPLLLSLTLSQFMRSRPADEIAIDFDGYLLKGSDTGKRETVASRWAGIGALGSELKYDLGNYLNSTGKNYELRFKIKLASGEAAD